MISKQLKEKVNQLIYARAYEIEEMLSDNDFLLAQIAGIGKDPIAIQGHSLNIAIIEIKKEFAKN